MGKTFKDKKDFKAKSRKFKDNIRKIKKTSKKYANRKIDIED